MSAKINGHPTHARHESLALLHRSCVSNPMCDPVIQKYVLFFFWTRRACDVRGVNHTQWKIILFIWTEILWFGLIFIGSMDLTLISYQTIIHYTACTAHQTASEQQNQMESIWRACMRQIVQIILLLYWFIEMALIFERNANLQFSTFDRFQKIKCMIYSTCKSTDSDTGWSACVYLFFVVIYFPR